MENTTELKYPRFLQVVGTTMTHLYLEYVELKEQHPRKAYKLDNTNALRLLSARPIRHPIRTSIYYKPGLMSFNSRTTPMIRIKTDIYILLFDMHDRDSKVRWQFGRTEQVHDQNPNYVMSPFMLSF